MVKTRTILRGLPLYNVLLNPNIVMDAKVIMIYKQKVLNYIAATSVMLLLIPLHLVTVSRYLQLLRIFVVLVLRILIQIKQKCFLAITLLKRLLIFMKVRVKKKLWYLKNDYHIPTIKLTYFYKLKRYYYKFYYYK